MDAGAIAQGEAELVWQVVAAAGTSMRIWASAISTVPFEDHFTKGETLGIGSGIAAIKLAVSGSLIKEISPISRVCSTGAFARGGPSVIVGIH